MDHPTNADVQPFYPFFVYRYIDSERSQGRAMKKLLTGLVILTVIVAGGIFFLIGNIDKILKGAMESVGSELMGAPVSVASVEIKLKNGAGQISGMTVANPDGYSVENAFQMDTIRLGLDIGSLGKQPLIINELTIDKPLVRLEVNQDGSSNLQTLMDNMKKNSSKADKKAAEEQPGSDSASKGEPVRMIFNKLSVTGVTVHVSSKGPAPQDETVVIPDIILTKIGDPSGLTPAELGTVIGGEIISSALRNALEKKLSEKVEEATKGLFKDIKKRLTQ